MKTMGSWRQWLVAVSMLLVSGLCLAQSQDESGGQQWYRVDSLNAGLSQTSGSVSLRTPREAMRSFRDLTDKGDFEAAAHLLNLADLTPAEQRGRGAELAQQLSEIFQRGKSIRISRLSGRQDAAIEDPTGESPHAGEPRRDIELASLEADGDTYDIRLGRYQVGNEEPVWLIKPESVAAIPPLYEEYGPRAFERHIPESLKHSFGLLRIWEWIAIPLVLLGIALIGKGVYRLIEVVTRWLPSGSPSIFAKQIRGPVALIVMSLLTQALLDYVVSFSAAATITLRVVLIAILAWGTGAVGLRLVDTMMLKMTRRLAGQIDDSKPQDDRKLLTTLYAVRRIIILILVTAVTLYVLGQIQLFETMGLSILASASVLAVLVGVAGQAVLGNILSSFQLSLAKPIRVGDLVMFEGQWCYVEGIFYTHIRLRLWNERRLIVPVTYFASKAFENLSSKSTKEYRSLALTLHLSADISILRDKFLEYAKAEGNVIEHHKLLCCVTDQTGPAQTVTCYLMTVDPLSGWAAEVSVREKLLAFIRDEHPEWWPRDVVVISHRDIARGYATGDEGETAA
ncbi:mechanosensitive ion channel protein MscS [Salinicola sp. MH3R3-1]|uniref:mechanosensitive ion channel family protein n=1 Tax=Salinicola sp. MH3R3-1 TaxID=1928762 RepID=UPI00094E9714|nr:mechanosensitive ion channel family protein [Salinicola sp. MH3R3-1]OLO07785.1 mechanosensitive ion channel protein MscS [Salinicola sp. MH3R3-1]